MSTVLSDKYYTVQDYMELNDGRRYELIGGELIVVPRPGFKHQKIGLRIAKSFENFLEQNAIGEVVQEVDVHLEGEVVAPDLLFIAKERFDIIGELHIQGAPDLVVEVLSPSTAAYDKKKKRTLYFANGVKEYWMVDPDQQLVEVLTAGENEWRWVGVLDHEDILSTALLPGLKINLSEIFKGLE